MRSDLIAELEAAAAESETRAHHSYLMDRAAYALSAAQQAQLPVEPRAKSDQVEALRDLLDAWHEGRIIPDSDKSLGYVGSLIEAGEAALLRANGPQAPIARLRIGADGKIEFAGIFAPGLPAGSEHDVYLEAGATGFPVDAQPAAPPPPVRPMSSDEQVAVEFYRLNPSAALLDFNARIDAPQPVRPVATQLGDADFESIYESALGQPLRPQDRAPVFAVCREVEKTINAVAFGLAVLDVWLMARGRMDSNGMGIPADRRARAQEKT